MDISKINEQLSNLLEEIEGEQLNLTNTYVPEKHQLKLEYNFDNGVSVSCHDAATNFIQKKFLPLLDEKEVRAKYKELLSLCKEMGIKVKGKKNAEAKFATYPQYKAGIEKYNSGVEELQKIWKKIVEEGIYAPTTDDKRLDNAYELEWSIDPLLYQSGPIHTFKDLAKRIDDNLRELTYQKEHTDSIFGKYTMIGF